MVQIRMHDKFFSFFPIPAGNYMFKDNDRNTRTRCEICSKLTVKIPKRRHWRRSVVFIVNFEHISHFVLVSIVNFEQVNVGWVSSNEKTLNTLTKKNFLKLFLTLLWQLFIVYRGVFWTHSDVCDGTLLQK